MTTKNERAANMKRLIDTAITQSTRPDHSDNVARPDSAGGSADWPKENQRRRAAEAAQQKGKP